jgi:hypothetical protein
LHNALTQSPPATDQQLHIARTVAQGSVVRQDGLG